MSINNVDIDDFNYSLKVIRSKVPQPSGRRGSTTGPPLMVALAGTPGSGKTTMVNLLARCLREGMNLSPVTGNTANTASSIYKANTNQAESYTKKRRGDPQVQQEVTGAEGGGIETVIIPLDGYHRYRRELDAMPDPKAAAFRRGAPFSFNPHKYFKEIQRIKITRSSNSDAPSVLLFPRFEHSEKDPVENAVEVDLKTVRVVIVEGIYTLFNGDIPASSPVPKERPEDKAAWTSALKLYDVKIYLNCPLEDTTERLTKRHMAAWGIKREQAFAHASGSDYDNGGIVVHSKVNADLTAESVPIHSVVLVPLVCKELSKM